MKAHQIESWALSIIDRVEAGQPNEDFRVELKSEWILPEKAGRRIAGHANAARGAPILWLIGVDEEEGVVGARHEDLADWYPQVRSQFDGLAPQFVDLNIPVGSKTVVALLFETERAPFVVKNPRFGKKNGGPVELEVPWREGTRVRSARRADLVRLLSPLQALPAFEVLSGTLVAKREISEGESVLVWRLILELYVETPSEDRVVIPYYRCRATCEVSASVGRMVFNYVRLEPPLSSAPPGHSRQLSKTIDATRDEVLIYGPGKICLYAGLGTAVIEESIANEARVSASLRPTNTEHPVPISVTLYRCSPEEGKAYRWAFARTS
jgi:hypothetical protein